MATTTDVPTATSGSQIVRSTAPGGPLLAYPVEEYEERWARMYDSLEKRGRSAAVIWQRSGGSYDRATDLHWLCNYASLSSGQEPARPGKGLGRAFAALVFKDRQEPVLHVAEPLVLLNEAAVATGRIESHDNLPQGVAESLRKEGVTGEVLHNGDDFVPIQFHRVLVETAPEIEWVQDNFLMYSIHRIKSEREQAAMRDTGKIAGDALSALMEGLINGKSEAHAAADAAEIIVASGGGIQRIGTGHGTLGHRIFWTHGLYGYSTQTPSPGDLVRGWVYGPLHLGIWLDPGRTAVAGNKPTAEQKSLIEANVNIAEELLGAIKPGKTSFEVGALGDKLMEEAGHDGPVDYWPIYGHGVGKDFYIPPIISRFATQPSDYDDTFEAGMAISVEIFLSRPGVGMAAIERLALVQKDGVEMLEHTPTLWW
jgi:Xaa-Pro aminopeptidase